MQTFTECCLDCGENIYLTPEEILREEGIKEIKAAQKAKEEAAKAATVQPTITRTTKMNTVKDKKYTKAQAFWQVTTEGDCEGRTVHSLGTHFGYIDDIAFALADKSYYSLCFKEIEPFDASVPTGNKVNVTLDIGSGTWDMNMVERKKFMENLLGDRDTAVLDGESYASVTLVMGKNEIQRQEREKEMLKLQALAKLSDEERAALGY